MASALSITLVVCTVLGGLAAVFYFSDRFGPAALRRLRLPHTRPPPVPVTSLSLGIYASTHRTPSELDQAIAADQGAKVEHRDTDWHWLLEQTKLLEISTISQLDQVVHRHRKRVRLMARALKLSLVSRGTAVETALEIEAMERFGQEWGTKYLARLTLTAADGGFAQDMWDHYQQIRKHGR